MSGSLTPEELAIVDGLRHEGISNGSAALAVAMVTREHSRPENELRDIIRQYQHLESAAAASDAIPAHPEGHALNDMTSAEGASIVIMGAGRILRGRGRSVWAQF